MVKVLITKFNSYFISSKRPYKFAYICTCAKNINVNVS